jgi:peroxiredoxin Q/BCP
MLTEGQPAPDFTLDDQAGRPLTLSTLRGSPVVLYFYPKDDTPGCTTEACDFRDAQGEVEAAGARVLGVSPDSVATHQTFAYKHGLQFTLLADPEKKVCEAYGVWKEKTNFGRTSMGVERTKFIIDKDGTISRIFPRVKVAGHVDAVIEAVKAL